MIEGILKNKESSNQSILFIRNLICVDDKMRKEKASFYNTLQVEGKIKENREAGELKVFDGLERLIEGLISKHGERLFNEKIFTKDLQKRDHYLSSSKTFQMINYLKLKLDF